MYGHYCRSDGACRKFNLLFKCLSSTSLSTDVPHNNISLAPDHCQVETNENILASDWALGTITLRRVQLHQVRIHSNHDPFRSQGRGKML